MQESLLDRARRRRWMARISRNPRHRGPWWTEILAGIALSYPECCYVEIGVEHGTSIHVVAPCCAEVHGCDIADRAASMPRDARFWHMSSDEFFARYDGRPPDLVFIDGGHSLEQARRDFENARRILSPGGTIALHDTWPGDDDAERTPERCGEVWRLEPELPEEKFTFRSFPGLTVVRP